MIVLVFETAVAAVIKCKAHKTDTAKRQVEIIVTLFIWFCLGFISFLMCMYSRGLNIQTSGKRPQG